MFSIYSPYCTWPLGSTLQSVSLPITYLYHCSYSNPLKEPFWSLCGRPSHRPSLFSRLAALCLLSVLPSVVGALPLSIHALSYKRAWTLEVAPSCFQGELLPVLSNTLAPALHPVLAHIWQRSGNTKTAWLLFPPYPHFISKRVSSFSCLCNVRFLPCFSALMVSCLWILKEKRKRKVWDMLQSDFTLLLYLEFLDFSDILERSKSRVCQRRRHFKELLPL